MNQPKLTAREKLVRRQQELDEKQAKLREKMKEIVRKEKQVKKKEDDRRKALLGGAILAELKDERGKLSETLIKQIVSERVKSDRDRALFEFLNLEKR